MKTLITFFILVFCLSITTMYGQYTFKVAWPLVADGSHSITGTGAGNIRTQDMALGGPLLVHDWTGGAGTGNVGAKIWAGNVPGWGAQEAGYDPARYIDFTLAPKAGTLTVDQVHLNCACYGTRGFMWAELHYSTDGWSSTDTRVDTFAWGLWDIRDGAPTPMTIDIGATIDPTTSDSVYSFRILPYYTFSSAGTTKYVCPLDVWISGSTDNAGGVGVAKTGNNQPYKFALEQNYPNPFNPSTNFTYELAKAGFVSVKIYDLLGRQVTTLVNGYKAAGSYPVKWNAAGFGSGIYFCKMQSGSFTATKRMILMK